MLVIRLQSNGRNVYLLDAIDLRDGQQIWLQVRAPRRWAARLKARQAMKQLKIEVNNY